ncbi:photosystem I reaction center subunit VIII [Iningainema tapete]|uniref:Photosystem I reaction center subunit VIII n=1 Tax=Iningainema tapete BLCC-T55 TaxID=2748662 RepID=A0A8J6XUH1_9CYAN|nr:photosystem I reaction center subunit VIII [Iningainema tapete]MBD2778744.1 photosystem I reaction center subunit VIII [Iningainema tapete BLCC-T55]
MATSFLPFLFVPLTAYAASFVPSLLVPLTGLVIPAVTFAFMLLYIERDEIG